MDKRIEAPVFDSIMRPHVLEKFQSVCRDYTDDFLNLFVLSKDIGDYLHSKIPSQNYKDSKEAYTGLFHLRARDHFSSSLVLVSQGYVVDALSITRASLEDLLVMMNFYIDSTFFNKWHRNTKKFKIVPHELRSAIRRSPLLDKEDVKFFDKVYAKLSNIVHPKKDSMDVMILTRNAIYELDFEVLKEDVRTVVLAFYAYQAILCHFLKGIYPEDVAKLNEILMSLNRLVDINRYFDQKL